MIEISGGVFPQAQPVVASEATPPKLLGRVSSQWEALPFWVQIGLRVIAAVLGILFLAIAVYFFMLWLANGKEGAALYFIGSILSFIPAAFLLVLGFQDYLD